MAFKWGSGRDDGRKVNAPPGYAVAIIAILPVLAAAIVAVIVALRRTP